jgi:hypothetical protein
MKDLRIPGRAAADNKATLTVDADTAVVVRKIASAEGRSKNLTALVDDMIRAYLAAKHPDWGFIVDEKRDGKKR